MLNGFLTTFIRLVREQTPDGQGGTTCRWTAGEQFRGGLAARAGSEILPGGLPSVKNVTVLAHLPGIVLHQGDLVKQVDNGVVWRVMGNSDDMTLPRTARTRQAQVPVERVVSAL